jgi:hypothetical protein
LVSRVITVLVADNNINKSKPLSLVVAASSVASALSMQQEGIEL